LLNGRTIILLPVANPDGVARNTRENAAGVDLNRNFEAANRINTPATGLVHLSEPETRIIKDLIKQHAPDRIVTIHQPLACIDYDGPAAALAARMAEYCDLPVKRLGAKPGSLGSYAGLTLAIPIITLELRQSDSQLAPESLWRKYANTLLAAIVYPETPASK
jgi:protein MpaA